MKLLKTSAKKSFALSLQTLYAAVQLILPGETAPSHRHTHSTIYQVFKGSGYTLINGEQFHWSKGDFFVVPNWAWHEHVVTSSEDAYLFSCSDLPIMEKFNLERKEAYEENQGHQQIVKEFVPLLP